MELGCFVFEYIADFVGSLFYVRQCRKFNSYMRLCQVKCLWPPVTAHKLFLSESILFEETC